MYSEKLIIPEDSSDRKRNFWSETLSIEMFIRVPQILATFVQIGNILYTWREVNIFFLCNFFVK